jgi:hypothetical protein
MLKYNIRLKSIDLSTEDIKLTAYEIDEPVALFS